MQVYGGVDVYISQGLNAFSSLGHMGCIYTTKLSTITIEDHAVVYLVEALRYKP
jgi:hypothetical protein